MPPREVLGTIADGYRVARMTEDDLPDVVGMLADDPLGSTREDPADAGYARAFRALAADPAHLLVVVLPPSASDASGAEDRALATLQLTMLPGLSRRGATRAQIEGVRVSAVARSTGLGSDLISWAIEHARASGADLVQLTTDATRTRAQEFYQRLGFTPSHVGMKLDLR